MGWTDRSPKGGKEGVLEEISQRTYMCMCIANRQRQQCGEGLVGQGLGGGIKKGKVEDICKFQQ